MEELRFDRINQIIEIINQQGRVHVSGLSKLLKVSESTIRRDLDHLHEMGKIQRVHGGAIVLDKTVPEAPVVLRKLENYRAKQKIGQAAARLVQDGETVFIGSGTTAQEVAKNLVGRKNLTVVTNALTVANVLAPEEQITLVILGGVMRHSELSFIGHITEQALREIRMDKAFMGIPGISLKAGLTNDYLPEVMTDRAIFSVASELILLADHTKFERVYSAFVSDLSRVHTLVTDGETDRAILERIRELNINVIIADR